MSQPCSSAFFLVAVIVVSTSGCQTGATTSAEGSSAPTALASAGSSQVPEVVAPADTFAALRAAVNDPAQLATVERPDLFQPGLQPCASDDECRIAQPSDWSADVECCYEYGCTLDYVAINADNQSALRAWQRVHPFDCTAHLQANGPCENRAMQCGLSQDPPAAACIEGQCAVRFPPTWPVIDLAVQTCAVDAECTPVRPGATTLQERCCHDRCDAQWMAVNQQTAGELRAWLAMTPAGACDDLTCGETVACEPSPPAVACASGLCMLAR